jgi:membrane protein insertase Oxa1/YidC/SpoIIIJ
LSRNGVNPNQKRDSRSTRNVRYFLSIVFLVTGLALFAGLVYWLWVKRDYGPESTDLPQRR